MLITCPYCGPRDVAEFTYQGDGNRTRPDPASTDIAAWNAYIFDRMNPAGDHNEIWQHSGGCRSHLAIVRNTLTHKVSSVRDVREAASPQTVRRETVQTLQTAIDEQAKEAAKANPAKKRPSSKVARKPGKKS